MMMTTITVSSWKSAVSKWALRLVWALVVIGSSLFLAVCAALYLGDGPALGWLSSGDEPAEIDLLGDNFEREYDWRRDAPKREALKKAAEQRLAIAFVVATAAMAGVAVVIHRRRWTLRVAGALVIIVAALFLALCAAFYRGDARDLGFVSMGGDVFDPLAFRAALVRLGGAFLVAAALVWGGGALLNRCTPRVSRMKKIWAVVALVVSFPLLVVGSFYWSASGEETKLTFLDLLQLWPITRGIEKASSFKLYEGLPHQVAERAALDAELATKSTVRIFGFPFYERPETVRPEDEAELRRLATSLRSYGMQTLKLCGGFHPDYCLAWTEGSTTYYVLVCFGCGEVIFYDTRHEWGVNLRKAADARMQEILERYGNERPRRMDKGDL